MDFGPLDFPNFNEAEVRGEFLDFLLRDLGYKSRTVNDIVREQSLILAYGQSFFGRKKDSDPPLRGKPDYYCIVGGKYRWVLEAKSPQHEISPDDIQQAYTYALHPEIAAIYYCLCNGLEFRIYRASHHPSAGPIFSVTYAELESNYQIIKNILSPAAIRRDFEGQQIDVGRPIGEGLRSICRINSGYYQFTDNNLDRTLNGLRISITGGSIERREDGKLNAILQVQSFHAELQKLSEKYGFYRWNYTSDDSLLSSDPDRPSLFKAEYELVLPKGEKMFDFRVGGHMVLPINMSLKGFSVANGVLSNNEVTGSMEDRMLFPEINIEGRITGNFKLSLF